jgi:hypothetical protein
MDFHCLFYVVVVFFSMNANGLCKWSAGLKVMNFQNRTEPIRLFIISNFPSIVKDELAVLQRRTAVDLPTATRITFALCYGVVVCPASLKDAN